MTRRLMAILVADVVGLSSLAETDEEGTLASLTDIRTGIFDPLLERYTGRIFKTTGDGILAAFDSVVDAVRCAIDIQTELKAHKPVQTDAAPLTFRMGVNLGDVVYEDGDFFGEGVNVAARLETLADPGGVCVSGAVYEQVRHKIETAFDDLGHQKLKNIATSVHVFRARFSDTASTMSNQFLFDVDKPEVKMSESTTGGCLCGDVRYQIDQPSIGAGLCHCRLCQRSIGTSVNAWIAFPAVAVHFASSEPKLYKSSLIAERGFCPNCGTSLTYRLLKPEDSGYLAIPIATLDRPENVAPSWHGGIESQMPWLDIKDELPRTRCIDAPSLQKAWASVGCSDPKEWHQ